MFRSDTLWRDLQSGSAAASPEAAAELASFLAELPAEWPLHEAYPTLDVLRQLRMPWAALFARLAALPIAACSFRDASDRENLVLLLSSPRTVATAEEPTQGGGDAGVSLVGGRLLHLSVDSPGLLRAHLRGSTPAARPAEMRCPVSDEVARVVICWLWTNHQWSEPPQQR